MTTSKFLLLSMLVLCGIEFGAIAAPRTDRNASWNVNFNRDGSDPSKYYGEWPGHSYFPSPRDWRAATRCRAARRRHWELCCRCRSIEECERRRNESMLTMRRGSSTLSCRYFNRAQGNSRGDNAGSDRSHLYGARLFGFGSSG